MHGYDPGLSGDREAGAHHKILVVCGITSVCKRGRFSRLRPRAMARPTRWKQHTPMIAVAITEHNWSIKGIINVPH